MRIFKIVAMAASLLVSSQGFALIEGQLLVGQRSISVDSSGTSTDYSGLENKVSVYLDPIPLIPVGIGITQSIINFDDTEVSGVNYSLKGSETSLDLTAWLPLGIAGFKPYAKVGFIVSGEYTSEALGTSTDLKATGNKIAVGIKYSPLPLIAFMLEAEKSTVSLEPDNGTSSDSDGTGILIGAAVGI